MRKFGRTALTLGALLAGTTLSAPALAQSAPNPLYRNWDENGVDLVQGNFRLLFEEASIGSGKARLSLTRLNNGPASSQWDQIRLYSTSSGGITTTRVTLPDGSEDVFQGSTNIKRNGAVLDPQTNGDIKHKSADGTSITFPGTDDTTRYRYDAARRLIGVTSPDPDGVGALKNRAVRYTYDTAGRVTKVERGTVNSQSDPDWALFATAETFDIVLDPNGRMITQKLSGSSGVAALTQLSYDVDGRPQCSAVRMNPAIYASLPGDACTLGTGGLIRARSHQ